MSVIFVLCGLSVWTLPCMQFQLHFVKEGCEMSVHPTIVYISLCINSGDRSYV
jgi:hypothetical protein